MQTELGSNAAAAAEAQFRQEILRLLEELAVPPRVLTATEARQRFFSLLDEVSGGPPVVIRRPKHDQTILMVRQAVLFTLIRKVLEGMAKRNEQMHLIGSTG